MKKMLELLWVYGLVLIGFVVRAYSDENTALTRPLWLASIISVCVAVFFLIRFLRSLHNPNTNKPNGLAWCLAGIIVEATFVFILIFSGNVLMWWFVGPEGFSGWTIPTWQEIPDCTVGFETTPFALLFIALRTILVFKGVKRWR